LSGLSYEAFQPPLYYILAAPAFLAVHNYRDKVLAVRAFDLLLLLAALAAIAALARAVFARRWLVPYCLALSVLMWPGVVVRAITVSNAALEFPLVPLFLLAVWRATERRAPGWLAGAGALLGLCVLTKITWVCLTPLLLIPLVALLRGRRDARALVGAAAAVVVPLVLLAPWLASNEARYGALTASSLAKATQVSFVNPTGRHYGLGGLASRLATLPKAVLPQEWWSVYDKPVLGLVLRLVALLLVVVAVAAVVRRPRLLRTPAAGVLAAPLPLALLTLTGILLLENWPSFLPRYAYATLAPFALFVAWAWGEAGWKRRGVLWLAGGLGVLAALAWVYVTAAFYFTNVGTALGIHAGAV
jgi:4-amino-4-deoxy-L-arabinose transferase-like glycosyltransferase